jgi:non-homologous end joining protein Ku
VQRHRQAKPFKPERYNDSYAVELRQLVEKKAKGQKIEIPPAAEPRPAKVVSIVDALKKSLKAEPAPAKKRASR